MDALELDDVLTSLLFAFRLLTNSESSPESSPLTCEIVQAYKFDRRIKDAPRKLRRGATSHEEGLAIVAAVADNPRCSAQEIKVNLGLKASKSTVKRRQAGLKSRTAEQKVLLRTDNKDKRLQFAQRHAGSIEQDWKKVMFTDESTFTTCWEQKTRIRRPDCTL
ncbi:hypothetical protein HPB50_017225 [Hyalomma asiaticum]|uniref:Uncharacterized protein n=1 Tax=Hyalomma asiaticum TaxID=266040 RepID=A0ACB7TP66_HYAAI|nr:hypothetical protein HPB50_017225 [Hyalomma asiaticum]